MKASKWEEELNVGNDELDSDHRMFFELLQDCYNDSCTLGNDRIDPDIIRRIKKYALMHFSYEEEVMRSSGYPDYERHEKLHRYFEEKVAELETSNKDPNNPLESMSSFLRDWFLKHIMEEDKKYAPYLQSKREAIIQ